MVIGSATADGDAIRLEFAPSALALINDAGLTQLRLQFAGTDGDAEADQVTFHPGSTAAPTPIGPPTLASTLGSASPSLDVTYDEPTSVAEADVVRPPHGLLRAEPNPFNPSTRIVFELSESEAPSVTLEVIDSAGRRVRTLRADAPMTPGRHNLDWNGLDAAGRPVASGVYHLRLITRGETRSAKIVVLR
jgi:hypothetical protein